MTVHALAELFPGALADRLRVRPIIVLPVGTVEWHSHHLPLGTDGIIAADIASAIADRVDAVLAPPSYVAVGGVPYPYTLTLPIEVVEPLLLAQYEQLGEMGFAVITVFAGHFGLDHTLSIKRAAVHVMRRSPVTILPVTEYDLVAERYGGDHAGIGETSLMSAIRPDLVRLDAVPAGEPLDGVIGADPRNQATAALGAELRGLIIERAAALSLRMLTAKSLERRGLVEAMGAGVRVLEATASLRRATARASVPPIATPAYLAHCQALWSCDYATAIKQADRKLTDLSA